MSLISMFKPIQPTESATPTQQPQGELDHIDLQELLLDMQKYGKPRIHCHDDNTWSCAIDVNISPVGAKFEVRSDFKQLTPVAAAIQCNERLAFLDLVKEEAEKNAEHADEQFDADFAIMTGELSRTISNVIAALGGEAAEDA